MILQEPKEITRLKNAIRAQHGCDALYVRSVRVNHRFSGVTPWHDLVCVFELVGHPEAECCYAWACRPHEDSPAFAVLHSASVTAPESAVESAIAEQTAGR